VSFPAISDLIHWSIDRSPIRRCVAADLSATIDVVARLGPPSSLPSAATHRRHA
jgi:hypothetical protein